MSETDPLVQALLDEGYTAEQALAILAAEADRIEAIDAEVKKRLTPEELSRRYTEITGKFRRLRDDGIHQPLEDDTVGPHDE